MYYVSRGFQARSGGGLFKRGCGLLGGMEILSVAITPGRNILVFHSCFSCTSMISYLDWSAGRLSWMDCCGWWDGGGGGSGKLYVHRGASTLLNGKEKIHEGGIMKTFNFECCTMTRYVPFGIS